MLKQKKTILIYTMTMNYGGTERVISNLANYFIKEYNILIVSNINIKPAFKLNNKIKYITIDKFDKSSEIFIKKSFTKISNYRTKILEQIIIKEQPDLIITFLPEPSIRALKIKRKYNIPVIVSIRNDPKSEFNFPLAKLIRNYYYKKADKITIQNKIFIKNFPKKFNNKFIVIPNMIGIKLPNKIPKKNIIINIGRLVKQKNHKNLIKAFNNLSGKYNNYKLYIYGEGPLKEKLNKLINKLNLQNRVYIKNNTNKIIDKINESKLFVLSSNYEGMPNSLLEACSVGISRVSTYCSPTIIDIIKDEKYISKIKDYKDLCKKIEYALENSNSDKLSVDNNEIYNKWDDLVKMTINKN